MRRSGGITGVELLVGLSVACLGVLATTSRAVPRSPGERLVATAGHVQTYLELGRVEALRRRADCDVVLDLDGRSLEVVDPGDPTDPADDSVLYRRGLPARLELESRGGEPAPTSARVVFSLHGGVARGAGVLSLALGRERARLVVAPDGHIRGERWDGASWLPDS